MFTKSATYYDALYSWKDYEAETETLTALIEANKRTAGRALLDVGCGTGKHLALLRGSYDVQGLDLDPELLAIARERCPDIPLHLADMVDFQLDQQFDVIVCLFSAIGYVVTVPRLQQTMATMTQHLNPGGVLVVEPWLTPAQFRVGGIHALFVDEPDLKIARMNVGAIENGVSVLDFDYLVGTPDGVEHFTEQHALALFSHEDYLTAFEQSGLTVTHDAQGLMGRGLYIGTA